MLYEDLITKIQIAVEEAECIRDDHISNGNYALAGEQESYIHGLTTAIDVVV